jgi:hypothetical protein
LTRTPTIDDQVLEALLAKAEVKNIAVTVDIFDVFIGD